MQRNYKIKRDEELLTSHPVDPFVPVRTKMAPITIILLIVEM